MERVKAFISYSSRQKAIGGKIKTCLTDYAGYEVFIAHSDISASSLWEEEIVKSINACDIFIPLISEDFKSSDFTDQETGIAVQLNKKIIPIKLERQNPYGFISKYQALQYKQVEKSGRLEDNIKELVLTVAQIQIKDSNNVCSLKALDSIVYAFSSSRSFDISNTAIQIMLGCNDFSSQHIELILDAIKSNRQINGAFGIGNLKEFLHRAYLVSID